MKNTVASFVVSSCGAINSAALLLRSANDKHPRGLANGSDVVGRHYMGHVNSILMAISKCPNPTVFQKTLSVNDFYLGSRGLGLPDGAHLLCRQARCANASSGRAGDRSRLYAGVDGQPLAGFLAYVGRSAGPRESSDPEQQGRNRSFYKLNNEEGHKRLIAKLESLMKQQTKCEMHGHECHVGLFSRNIFVGQRIPLAGVAHQNGTIRFGDDPKTSALDANCRAHEVENLYVVDASFFPSSGAVNPGLTIMANALRVGDHLIEQLG